MKIGDKVRFKQTAFCFDCIHKSPSFITQILEVPDIEAALDFFVLHQDQLLRPNEGETGFLFEQTYHPDDPRSLLWIVERLPLATQDTSNFFVFAEIGLELIEPFSSKILDEYIIEPLSKFRCNPNNWKKGLSLLR